MFAMTRKSGSADLPLHGGKDRHPFPVPLKVYDQTIDVMKSAIQKAKLGNDEELAALKRLDNQSRMLERHASGPSVEKIIRDETRLSLIASAGEVFSVGNRRLRIN